MINTSDKKSRLYGFRVTHANVPEYPDVEMFVDMRRKTILINKGARKGAKVVRLSF